MTLLVAAVLMATGLFAQTSTSGSITGTLRDASGPLPGVTVEITSPNLQGSKVEVTDNKGGFRFSLVPPGNYTLSANLSGYSPVKQTGIEVGLGRTVTLDVTMSQAVAEQITVTASAPVVDTQSASSGANVTSEMFETLPVARNFYSVAQIAPGTGSDNAGTTFHGSTGAENQYIIDGLNTTGVELGDTGKTLNFDFIQEVEVKTGGLPAEYGRITGGIITAITKSGGNEFHGGAFGYSEGGGLASDNSTAAERPATTTQIVDVDEQLDFGVYTGGYFVKDRLWFFGAYNRVTETDTRTIIRDIATASPGAPAVGSVIPLDITRDLYSGKLTFRVNDAHNLNLSFFGDPSTQEGPIFNIAGPASTWQGTNDTGGVDYIVRYEGIFGPTFLVNASAGTHHEETTIGGLGRNIAQLIDSSQRDPVTNKALPTALSGGFGFFQDQTFDRDVYKIDFSKFFSSHDIKFGGDFEDMNAVNNNYNGGAGQRVYKLRNRGADGALGTADDIIFYRHRFYIDDTAPGFDRADPNSWTLAVPLTSEPQTKNTSAYIQDTWKALPNLTLNVGFRYERQEVIGRDGSVSIDLDDNYSPRLGLIFDVLNNGRSKMYANYGRFYESVPMDINIRAFGGEVSCFCYNYSPNPADTAPVPGTPSRSSLLGGSTEPVDPDLKGQYIDEYILGYEQEVGNNLAIGVKGTYRNLGRVIEDFLLPSGEYFIANPGEGIGEQMTFYDYEPVDAPKGKRKYTGVELTARKRFSTNFQFFASYLWSKLEGNYDGVFQVSTGQLDPNINSAFDYADFMINADGKLSNDRTHTFKFDGSYIVGGGPVKGLTLGLSTHYSSGTPLTAYGYSFAYQNWEYYLSERGSLGRGPADYEADIHIGYPWKVGAVELNFIADIFNALDRQAKTQLDQRYNLTQDGACAGIADDACNGDGGLLHDGASLNPVSQLADPRATATNPDFLKAGTQFTAPRSIRLGVRLTF